MEFSYEKTISFIRKSCYSLDMKTGVIFNIQKFSVNDGPGIRTVVFFKGCPLHCKWCANPESQLQIPQIFHDAKKCTSCQRCKEVCPSQSITFNEGKIHLDPYTCQHCQKCIKECPNSALEMQGSTKDIDEILKVVMQDEVFYEESGGGITLSGGEILMQPDFASELLKASKEKNLHTCIETTGFTTLDNFRKVIEYVDYIFFDCKHWNDKKHQEGTGVSNTQILSNLQYAIETKKEVLVRIPVIPGFNADLEDAKGFAKIFNEIGVKQCQLLPFHQFGENKYDLLNENYYYKDVPALHKEDLKEYQEILIKNGIDAFF